MTPEDLYTLSQGARHERLSALACHYFRRKPHEAARLFGAYFYTSRDGWQPNCRTLDIVNYVPETAPLLETLQAAYGAQGTNGSCTGSITEGMARAQHVARQLATVELVPGTPPVNQSRAEKIARLNYTPGLAHWAQQGLWEKRQAERIAQQARTASAALQRYYQFEHGLKRVQATATAGYHVQRLLDVYVGRVGATSTFAYSTACYDRTDLDAYLASGELPQKRCPYPETINTSPPAQLRYLLILALVNDYPLTTIERLLGAGAPANPLPSKSPDARPETPLMIAAARPDAINVLLKAGADPSRQNNVGKTALMYAIAEKQPDSVRALIAAGVDVNMSTFADPHNGCNQLKAGSRSPLMYAAWHATPGIVGLLLDHGADPAARDSNGETALDYLPRNQEITAAQRSEISRLLRKPRAAALPRG